MSHIMTPSCLTVAEYDCLIPLRAERAGGRADITQAAVMPIHTAINRVYATFHPYVRFVLWEKSLSQNKSGSARSYTYVCKRWVLIQEYETTKPADTAKIMAASGGPGQYIRIVIKIGKATAVTAARPYRLPWPFPALIYQSSMPVRHPQKVACRR